MNEAEIQLVHEACADNKWIEAANLALIADDVGGEVKTEAEAMAVLRALEWNLAMDNRYLEIAVLLWGDKMFTSKPQAVRDVFEEVIKNHTLIILGCSSSSKTFSCGVLYYLYWRNDPYWTAVKLAGPSEDHLYGNLFSHIVALHKAAVIPMTADDSKNVEINETDMFIGMHDALPEMRIKTVLCKQNQTSASGLRGHKSKPYRTKDPHPKLGIMTRIYILIDECTQVSPGAFEDINTTKACINPNTDSVKIVMACNPEGVSYKVVEMAEPEEGWEIEQVDTLYKWKSKRGYPVLRLDGKKCENVQQRKIIYDGFLSYETYLDFLKAGENSGSYWAKGRGFPPLKDSAWTMIPPNYVQSQRGEPIYIGKVTNIGMLDTALQGADKALWGIGRWGAAAGWRKANGETEWFVNRADPTQRINKHVAVLDQIFQIPKTPSTVEIITEVMGRAKLLGIAPEDCVFDKTGNAAGVWSHAKKYWGDVLGVDFGSKASEDKILAEDQMTAYDVCDGKVTELWMALKRWYDPVVCAFMINPIIPSSPIATELTTRRYRNVKGGRIRIEPKEEYKSRNSGVSPDSADLATLLVEWCRQRGGVTPGIQEQIDNSRAPSDMKPMSIESAEEDETLEDGQRKWEPGNLPHTEYAD